MMAFHGWKRCWNVTNPTHPNRTWSWQTLTDEGNNAEVARWSRQALAMREDFRPAVVKLVPALFALHQDAEATKALEETVKRYPQMTRC